ncbi:MULTISPECIES: hypothetical protein [unclassified Thioalkalivibrio]|uniref:hypothetical protein n=1 Tax=unclassified Thioalkalivibrio TaxID=2621013 RepID=UPI000365ABAF|nr:MULTISPECIES: hypothetical protein [unclassified Thioalkalivibrio]
MRNEFAFHPSDNDQELYRPEASDIPNRFDEVQRTLYSKTFDTIPNFQLFFLAARASGTSSSDARLGAYKIFLEEGATEVIDYPKEALKGNTEEIRTRASEPLISNVDRTISIDWRIFFMYQMLPTLFVALGFSSLALSVGSAIAGNWLAFGASSVIGLMSILSAGIGVSTYRKIKLDNS